MTEKMIEKTLQMLAVLPRDNAVQINAIAQEFGVSQKVASRLRQEARKRESALELYDWARGYLKRNK